MKKRVYIENGVVTVEDESGKRKYGTFTAAAEALGLHTYEEAEAMMKAVEEKGEYAF